MSMHSAAILRQLNLQELTLVLTGRTGIVVELSWLLVEWVVHLTKPMISETPVNSEIGAISQHQDPASENAAAINKAITLALAQQIASIGGDPLVALESGTFAPGDTSNATGKGNTCDDPDDEEGCIFTLGLLVDDATEEGIKDGVAGIPPAVPTDTGTTATATAAGCPAPASSDSTGNQVANNDSADLATETTSANTNNAATAGIYVGQCTDFSLTFAAGLPGRKADEFTFQPTDLTNFNHGSALNPTIITTFMCDTFVNQCAQSATTRDVGMEVAADVDAQLQSGALKKDQGFADAWLTALEDAFGIQSTGTGTGTGTAGAAVGTAAGDADADAADDDAAAGANADADTADTDTKAGDDAPAIGDADASSDGTANAATDTTDDTTGSDSNAAGTNLQTFSSALNGVIATPVINIGGSRPFKVKEDTFVNAGAAFQRSCDQQFNGCANAANSGQGDASVAECSAQKDECGASIPVA